MLKVITLYTIQKIFELEATDTVSQMTKLVYINTLMHYFEDKEATTANCGTFEILKADIKNPTRTMKYFYELENACLVVIGENTISFENKWYKYIDKSKLDKISPEEHVAMASAMPGKSFEKDLLGNVNAFDLLGMRHKLSPERISELIKEFIMESAAKNKTYYNAGDCANHCINWFNKKMQFAPKNPQKGTGKILGM